MFDTSDDAMRIRALHNMFISTLVPDKIRAFFD